jgi:hypothetical protein
MRYAVLILGLILGAFMFMQAGLIAVLSGATGDTATNTAGGGGIIMALLWLVACALVIALPLVSAGVFALAGVVGFSMSPNFPDLAYWGGASLVLAALSLIGWYTKRRGSRAEAARHAELLAAARGSSGLATSH